MKRARWTTASIALGAGLFLYANTVLAQAGVQYGPDWSTWFKLVVGVLLMVIGAYVKGVNGRLAETQADVKRLAQAAGQVDRTVAMHDMTLSNFSQQLAEIKSVAISVQRRLDQLHVPSAFPHD